MCVRSPPLGVETPYMGPIMLGRLKRCKMESRYCSLVKAVDDFTAEQLKPNYVLVHSVPNLTDSRPFKWLCYDIEPRHTYILELSDKECI